VPAFIAANYVMSFGPEHNIYPAVPRKTYFEVDTVVVKEQMSFEQLSQALDVSQEEILYFNPQYRKNIIPAGGNAMCLPKNKIGIFLTNEQDIYAAIKAQEKEGVIVESLAEVKKTHTVKAGEKLSTIARKYGVTVADLKSWNYVGKKGLRPGKKLIVYVKEQQTAKPKEIEIKADPKADQNLAANKENDSKLVAVSTSSKSEYFLHKVKKGESLFSISKKHSVAVDDIKALNNLQSNDLNFGQVLKIKSK
jgi:membrane-bound lytic murein transglycosylase D